MIDTIAFVLTGIGLAASIIYYANILNNANKTRELQLKSQEQALETRQMQIWMHYMDMAWDEDIQEVYFIVYGNFNNVDEFMEKFNTDNKFYRVFLRYAYWWDAIGTMVKQGLVPIEYAVFAGGAAMRTILQEWENFSNVVYRLRERRQRTKRDFDNWEYLYDELVKYLEEHPEHALN